MQNIDEEMIYYEGNNFFNDENNYNSEISNQSKKF